MFKRILIANRGEIALRIIRACRELGVETVAIFSEADRGAHYLELADQAICVGPAKAADSYLKINRVISTAKTSNSLGENFTLSADVSLGALTQTDVRVQALVGRAVANRELSDVQIYDMEPTTDRNWAVTLTCDHVGQVGYVVRVVPYHPDVRIDHEIPVVTWQQI